MGYEVQFFQLGGGSDLPEQCQSYLEAVQVARNARDSYLAAHPDRGLIKRSAEHKWQAIRADGIVEFQARISMY
ncbi:MAG TPA: hypothetical protein VKA48_10530 [Gammaproteobacteria bacterium]|nr:hypothetical protein [Gammaproteobacteria bacterium]